MPVVDVVLTGAALNSLPGVSEGEQRAGGGGQEPVGAGSYYGEGEEGEKTVEQQLHPEPALSLTESPRSLLDLYISQLWKLYCRYQS